jgi:hypothetical protein
VIGSISIAAFFVLGSSLHVGLLSALLSLTSAAWNDFLHPRPVVGFGATGVLLFVAGAVPRSRTRYEVAGLTAGLASVLLWPSVEGILTLVGLGAIYVAMVRRSDDPARPLRALRSAVETASAQAASLRTALLSDRAIAAPHLDALRPLLTSTELMLRLIGAASVCLLLVSIRPGSDGWAATLAGMAVVACIVAASRPSALSRWLVHFAIVAIVAAAWVVPIGGSVWVFALKQTAALLAGIVLVVTDHHLAVCGSPRSARPETQG